jgi:hypothetical protein
MEFLKSLPKIQESRLLPFDRSYRRYSLREILDLIFLYVLALEIMSNEQPNSQFLRSYFAQARRDLQSQTTKTDLGALIAVFGDENKFEKLRSIDAVVSLAKKFGPVAQEVQNWLTSKTLSKWTDSRNSRFLYSLEQHLAITSADYKNVRRLVQNWQLLDQYKKQLAFTRMIQALRARASTGDIIHRFDDLAQHQQLELKTHINAETGKEQSQPVSRSRAFGFLSALAGAAVGSWAYSKLKESEDHSYKVTETIVKRIKSHLGKNGYLGPASAEIDDIVVEVANEYGILKVDAYRFFEQHMGKDPQTWYELWCREGIQSFYETTTAGSVASVNGGFDPDGEWRSIYSKKPALKKIKKQPVIKRSL